MSKTITAFFGPGQRSVKTDPLFQWDDGVILKFSGLDLPDTFAVDFSNSTSGGAKKRNTGNSEGVLVPAEVFTSGTEIYAWPVGTDEIGSHTEAVVVIPLDRRARPAGALPPGPQDDDAKTIITEAVNAWMDAHAGEMGGGISEAIKNALLQLAEHVAYIDEHGQDYYDDLEAALNYVKELTAISAQFSQGEAVIYDTDTLDTLRRYLAVVAQYNDSTSELVTNYTLSGVLESGTSSITAAYEGKTDTFDVAVTARHTLSSITAVYTQGNRTVFSNDGLDSLIPYLVVTASYSDGTTETVSAEDYTLYGELNGGTSAITVSYGGKTDTFDVTVTAFVIPSGYTRYDYIKKKTDTTSAHALSNFIFLNDQQDMNSLSIEIYLARKAVTDGAGLLGARVDDYAGSVSFYCAVDGGDLLRFVIRGVSTSAHIDLTQDRATKVEIINPETSPAYWRVDGGELHEVVWESSPAVPYGFALFNNFPHSATSKFNINKSAIIGDIILRKADGECVGYYVPCVYSGKIGMYDIISETFYTAATAAAVTISNSGCLYAVGNW